MPTPGPIGTPPSFRDDGAPSGPPSGAPGPGRGDRPPGPPGPPKRRRSLPGRQLALLGVAGESVGVLAGAAGWRWSAEPAWLVMSGISLALALLLLKRV